MSAGNIKGSKIWSALTEVLLFFANAPDNYLERRLHKSMKRGVSRELH